MAVPKKKRTKKKYFYSLNSLFKLTKLVSSKNKLTISSIQKLRITTI